MEADTFEWREYATRLVAGRRTIGACAAIAFVVGLALGLLDRHRYESQAWLAVAKPELAAEFDERLGRVDPNPTFPYQVATLRAYAELAGSQAVAVDAARALGYEDAEAHRLLERVRAEALADGSLLVIRARAQSPAEAAELADAWAAALVRRSDRVFANRLGTESIADQRGAAAEALGDVESRLAAFQAENRIPSLEVELEGLQREYAAVLASLDRLDAVRRDLDALRAQLASGGSVDLADRMAALSLQWNTLATDRALPLQLDVPASGLDAAVGPEDLDALDDAATEAESGLQTLASELPDRIVSAHADLEALRTELEGLERDRGLAEERYVALARKASEVEVSATSGPELRLAGDAIPPDGADWAGVLETALAAAVLGALAGSALVLARPERFAADRRAAAD